MPPKGRTAREEKKEDHSALVPEVVRVEVSRHEITAEDVPELQELFRIDRLPLAQAQVTIELKGIPTAVVNAIRRAVTDEMPGRALQVPPGGFDTKLTTDQFMLPHFVNMRIALLPLRTQIPTSVVDQLRLRLNVTNTGASPLSVYAGDLEVVEGRMTEPLFNPTTKLAFLQPGKSIVINDISIATGYGFDNAAFIVARRAMFKHLDIPEYTDEEMRLDGGPATDLSGYKISCMRAYPQHHVLKAILPATTDNPAASRAVFADACSNIKGRLRLISTTIDRHSDAPSARKGIQYTEVELESGLMEGILQIPNETHTIGELLRRTIFDIAPDLASIEYEIVSHENRLVLTVRHTENVTRIIQRAVHHAINTFDIIQKGITAAR